MTLSTERPMLSSHGSEMLLLRRWLTNSRARPLRRLRDFAEQEIVLPDGPFSGQRFRVRRQPAHGLLFDAIDSDRWNRIAVTGPTQSGKSLSGYVIPAIYHLFEVGENVILAAPDMDIAADKWTVDILPVIEASRYKDQLPVTGAGSRGGKPRQIRFNNGRILRFMTAGGSDKSRSAFTSRVVIMTEVDGYDEPGQHSRESDKVTQLEARSRAFLRHGRPRIYMECTTSIEDGRIWQEYQKGSASQIALPCPHCAEWVCPEREHLVGWQDAATIIDASEGGAIACPNCGGLWTDDQRDTANAAALLVHKGQTVEEGAVVGDPPKTDTLGFRYNAANNLFQTQGAIAAEEWRAQNDPDERNADKKMRQVYWALPAKPDRLDVTDLDDEVLVKRQRQLIRGMIPKDAVSLAVGIDVGKWLCHWVALAALKDGSAHVIDYGRLETAADDIGVEKGLTTALRAFETDATRRGWLLEGTENDLIAPAQVWVDSGYQSDTVYALCNALGKSWMPVKGIGWGTGRSKRAYRAPANKTGAIREVGDGYHIARLRSKQVLLVDVDTDRWKSWVHERLAMPDNEPGALTLYAVKGKAHTPFVKHLTSEKQEQFIAPGRGFVTRWVNPTKRANHWLDATAYAACALSRCLNLGLQIVHTGGAPDGKPRGKWFGWAESKRKR